MSAALYDLARHEPLATQAWDAARAQAVIHELVADIEDAIEPGCTWPWHELDTRDPTRPRHRSLYMGAAGVLWALWYLEGEGAARLRVKPAELFERLYPSYLEEPDTGEVVPSYFLGEVGILLPLWRMTGARDVPERLASAIDRNIPTPTSEALWGAPGTMLGSLYMRQWTGDAEWEVLFRRNAEHLWRTWERDAALGCYLWIQDLYGKVAPLLGPGHGFAGNAYALLRGADLLSEERREILLDRCAETLRATAVERGDCANWRPTAATPESGGDPKMLVQWCHGAPGMVTALAEAPVGRSPVLDALLVKGGNLTWEAGPLAKGFGLCHGTAGNGYAFLKLHARTGDPAWLERARSFAMHAIGQAEAMREQYGRRRYSLWTGDPGLAIYLWHCIVGAGDLPSLDFFD
jgi:hypothetical protein